MNDPSRRRRIAGETRPDTAPKTKRSVRTPARKPKQSGPRTKTRTAYTAKSGSGVSDASKETRAKFRLGAFKAVLSRNRRGLSRNRSGSPRNVLKADNSDAEAGGDAVAKKPLSRRTTVAVLLVSALVAVAGSGFALWQNGVLSNDQDIVEQHQEAAEQAGKGVVTVFSYDYEALDEHLESSKKLMTESFADDFEEIAPALAKLTPENRFRVKANTRQYAPMDCGDECSADEARVLVFLDQARTQGQGEPKVFGDRISVNMVKKDGDWLIDDIRNL